MDVENIRNWLYITFRGPRGLPDVPAVRVLGGEHPLLAGLRGPQEGAESRVDRGEGETHSVIIPHTMF